MDVICGVNDDKRVDLVPRLIKAANLLPNFRRIEQRILLQQAAQVLQQVQQSAGKQKTPIRSPSKLLDDTRQCAMFISITPSEEISRIMLSTAEEIKKLQRCKESKASSIRNQSDAE